MDEESKGLYKELLIEAEELRRNPPPAKPPEEPPKGLYERLLWESKRGTLAPPEPPKKPRGVWAGYQMAAERARREDPERFANAQKQKEYFRWITTHPDLRGREWIPFQKEWLREARKGQRRFPEDDDE